MKALPLLAAIIITATLLTYCTKKDQVVTSAVVNTNELTSYKTTVAPTIDGQIDDIWNKATKLDISPEVPDPGNGLFTGYIGEQYPATIRSMYDNDNIYFLVEWADATKNNFVSPWYFDPSTKRWAQEPSSRTFNSSGVLSRAGWGEDKLAMLWNINYSTPKFLTQTCYASCHVFSPYMDYSKNPAVYTSNAASGNHYTNGPDEKIDMWWGRLGYMSQDASLHFMDDNYQDWAGGPSITNLTGGNANGRHVDDIYPDGTTSATWPNRPNYTVSPVQGEITNRVTLKLNGTGASVNVPLWVIPGSSGKAFIMATDTLSSGTARKVVGVDSTGVLTLNDGSTIDPTTTTDYNRPNTDPNGATALKAIPGIVAAPLIGGRSDIKGVAVYTGTGWIVEYSRKLKTADVLKQDIDFSSLNDQQFGVAIWNGSNYQHGINPNLVLTFQK